MSFYKHIKQLIKSTRFYHRWLMLRLSKRLDPEIGLLNLLCESSEGAVDVGAANGVYTTYLARCSSYCYAFEPVPERARRLMHAFKKGVTVIECALSSSKGTTHLNVPLSGNEPIFGRATIEPANDLADAPVTSIEVAVETLDGQLLPTIGFIKIDVEGHELDVLQGGIKLIERDLPTILVEAEERHKRGVIATIRGFLEPRGYSGWFLFNGFLYPITEFDLQKHQKEQNAPAPGVPSDALYINNFIFVARNSVMDRIVHLRSQRSLHE